jgi:hypothetical protein
MARYSSGPDGLSTTDLKKVHETESPRAKPAIQVPHWKHIAFQIVPSVDKFARTPNFQDVAAQKVRKSRARARSIPTYSVSAVDRWKRTVYRRKLGHGFSAGVSPCLACAAEIKNAQLRSRASLCLHRDCGSIDENS